MYIYKTALILIVAGGLVACSGDAGTRSEGDSDTSQTPGDAVGSDDAGSNDAGSNDAGSNDAGQTQPGDDVGSDDADQTPPDAGDPGPQNLSQQYPRDEGIGDDPAVVWHENFEQSSIEELAERYQTARTNGMTFSSQTPALSSGSQSVAMASGGDFGSATDLFTTLPGDGYDQLYIRYYVRHEEGANYHHTRAGLGGYNPPSAWPQGGAGQRPSGDDRLSVTVEPMTDGPARRMDFYNYWMNMHSWEAGNPPDGSAYGNTLAHRTDFVAHDGQWHCLEVMARLNDAPGSAEGGELAAWIDDELVYHYTEDGPLGYWIRDKFCPADADNSSCLNYAPPEDEREQEVLNLQWRNSLDLKLNYLWIQNYISSGDGSVEFDDVVVATTRIGCMAP